MSKTIKYILIFLAALIAVLCIAIGVVMNTIFTPSRLTPIVNEQAAKYITCPVKIGEVEPTFFSTFPNIGLRLADVTIINPKEGAQSDTLLHVGTLDAIIDAMKFLDESQVDISRFILKDVQANIFVAADSSANYDIMVTDEEEDDTDGESEFDLKGINLHGIALDNVSLTYVDRTSGMEARVEGLQFQVEGQNRLQELEGQLSGELKAASIAYCDSAQQVALYGLSIPTYAVETHSLANLQAELKTLADSISYQQKGQKALTANVQGLELPVLKGSLAEGRYSLDIENQIKALTVSQMPDGVLANQLPVRLSGHIEADTLLTNIQLTGCQLQVKEECINLSGNIQLPDSVTTEADVEVKVAKTSFDRLLALVPQSYKKSLAGMTIQGELDNIAVKADVAMIDTTLEIYALNVTTDLAGLRYAQGKSMQAQLGNVTFAAQYPVANEKMEKLKQSQQTKRQKKTHINRRSKAVGQAQFMEATLKGKTVHMLMQDSSRMEATIPSMTFKGTFSDEILHDANSLPFIAADFAFDHLDASMDTMSINSNNLSGSFVMADGVRGMKKYYEATFACNDIDAVMGRELHAVTGPLEVEASSVYDYKQKDPLLMYNPVLNVNMKQGDIRVAEIAYPILIPNLDFDFNLGRFIIRDGQVSLGNSDFQLAGNVLNIQQYLKKEGMLTADLRLKSRKTDVYQLMDIVDGLNLATDSTEMVAANDTSASSNAPSAADIEAANPFMVPQGVKVLLTTQIQHAICGENDFSNLGGKVTIDDGVLVLEEMGFSSKAARMQMTALYKSPRKNHLFVGLNFHLLDIEIADLLHMVPEIDTIVPMLKSFDGKGEFHIAAETNLFANYEPKMSTLKATAAIEGKDLVLMDNETFSTISKYLMFNKKTRNVVDTLSVEMAVARKKATVYPMLIGLDKYQAVISGNHDLTGNMGFNYHISVTDAPLVGGLIGLDITGDLEHPEAFSYKVGKCKYANLYKPERRNVTQEQTLRLKELISTSLKSTVKPQTSEVDSEM